MKLSPPVVWFTLFRLYNIFGNKMKAIDVCTTRFDDETKQSFMELYDKVDANVNMESVDETLNNDMIWEGNSISLIM